tara:strand:- start:388 stop:675 length:288 start_codon:yes stop_codon:yes gene_type:complete
MEPVLSKFNNPNEGDRLVDENGLQTQQTLEFLAQVASRLNNEIALDITLEADLASLDAKYKQPNTTTLIMVTGQGLARFNGTNWVLAADDTTLIT